MGVAGPILTQKIFKGSMIKWYPYSTRWEQNTVAIIHIYEARAIFLLICDNQDTEYETCEIEMSITEPIFTKEIF